MNNKIQFFDSFLATVEEKELIKFWEGLG